MDSKPLWIEMSQANGEGVVTVAGRVAIGSSPRLRVPRPDAIRVRQSPVVVIDASGIEYLDTYGTATLLQSFSVPRVARRACAGARAATGLPTAPSRRVLTRKRLMTLFRRGPYTPRLNGTERTDSGSNGYVALPRAARIGMPVAPHLTR